MNDLRGFLTNFLTTIDYPDDKDEFINQLTSTIYLEAVSEVLKSEPQDKQDRIKQQLSSATTPEALLQVVDKNFDQETFQETLKTTSQKVFADYLETINPVLTDEQKTKLEQFFATNSPQNQSQS